MYILHPDKYLLPDYKISPFQSKDIVFNNDLPSDSKIDDYFKNRWRNRSFIYTNNGRSALNKALSYYHLQPTDLVTILTTTGNFYVSSCVTTEVEKFCKWNRQVEPMTRVIIVIHEFGYPYPGLIELSKLGVPIIEDCAYAFFSLDSNEAIGRVGEFCVYSFPKMFPIQIGGLLTFLPDKIITQEVWSQEGVEDYVKKVLSYYIANEQAIIQKRMINEQWLEKALSHLNFSPRFEKNNLAVPGVYMFQLNNSEVDVNRLKEYLYAHGIQCSVFYGERSFFIPNHQALSENDLLYFVRVIESFIESAYYKPQV